MKYKIKGHPLGDGGCGNGEAEAFLKNHKNEIVFELRNFDFRDEDGCPVCGNDWNATGSEASAEGLATRIIESLIGKLR